MTERKNFGVFVTNLPEGKIRKQVIYRDGSVLMDEVTTPHEDLLNFLYRPLDDYRALIKELEEHPLFEESAYVSPKDYVDLDKKCIQLMETTAKTFPEAHFFIRAGIEWTQFQVDNGSAMFLLNMGAHMCRTANIIYDTHVRMRNIMEVCFGTTDNLTQEKRWNETITTYPQLANHTFESWEDRDEDTVVRKYRARSLLELYFLELYLVLQTPKRIARCKCCWRYFIPKTKKQTDYCDRVWQDGQTCKQHGSNLKRKDKPAKDVYLKKHKVLRARFYERYDKQYQNAMSLNEYFEWSEMATVAREAYLKGDIDGEEFMRRINPNNEPIEAEIPKRKNFPLSFPSWKELLHSNMDFDEDKELFGFQFLDLGAEDPQWEDITAKERKRWAKGDDISLMEKYEKEEEKQS